MSDDDFETKRQAIITKIAVKDVNLREESNRIHQEISSHKYIFDRQEQELSTLKTITKAEVQVHFERVFFSNHTKRLDYELNSVFHKAD